MADYQLTSIASIVSRLGQRTDGRYDNVFWTEAEKLLAIQEALTVWQCMVGQWQISVTSGIVAAGTENFYKVPRQIAGVTRVLWAALTDRDSTPLHLVSLFELDRGWPGWHGVTQGTPLYWAPNGLTEVAIYPAPNVAGTLTFQGFYDLSQVTLGDNINIGNEELTRVLDYARHYLTWKEGMSELQTSSGALTKMAEAASAKNARINALDAFKKYKGKDHQAVQQPIFGTESLGVRG